MDCQCLSKKKKNNCCYGNGYIRKVAAVAMNKSSCMHSTHLPLCAVIVDTEIAHPLELKP